jgi:hypothetical protein
MIEPWSCQKHNVLVAFGKTCPLCLEYEKKKKEKNRKSHNEAKKRYRQRNHEKQNDYFRKYYKRKYYADPEYRKMRYNITRKWLKKVMSDPVKAKKMRRKMNEKSRRWRLKVKDTEEYKEKNRRRSREYYYNNKRLIEGGEVMGSNPILPEGK